MGQQGVSSFGVEDRASGLADLGNRTSNVHFFAVVDKYKHLLIRGPTGPD